ncbi:MAG: M4 family metallopeptidase [Nocardioides sp.]|uniref:M4 family metallopeptidase n=1 Tax=Nocardioides sp. TaxID=35761 RepID=UPI003F02C1D9
MTRASSSVLRRAALPLVAVGLAVSGMAVLAPAGAQPAASDKGFGSATVEKNDDTGVVGFVGAKPGQALASGAAKGASARTAARTFVTDRATQFGLRAEGTTVEVTGSQAQAGGGDVVRLQQEIGGLPVFGGQFVVSLDESGDVQSVAGEATPETDVETTAAVSKADASATAVAAVAKYNGVKKSGLRVTGASLEVFDPRLVGATDPFGVRPAWVVDVRGTLDVGRKVVVDARTGTVALAFDLVHAAKNRIVCDANNADAHYPCTSPVWTESSQPANGDLDVQRAFAYAGHTYDFFKNRFNRDSLNGAGMQLKSTVDYCPAGEACPYPNAFWDGAQMVYGDGFATADDVVGHELAHGFTTFSSNLFYYAQSGAINESLSDVFGELIDQSNGAGNDAASQKWLLGEDLPSSVGVIRNMKNPGQFGDPDRMHSPRYWKRYEDGEGVHINSGVGNKAAFLITDGGSFNGQSVTGLGLTKTARLYYTVNTTMLTSGSNYSDLAKGLRQACANLVSGGVDGFVAGDCTQVDKAVKATEMDKAPLGAAAPRSASVCPTGRSVAATTWSDDLETQAGQFTKQNISGSNGWYWPQNSHPFTGLDVSWASSGKTNAWGYNQATITDSALRMTNPVTVPANAYMHFRHAYLFEFNPANGGTFDGGVLEYSTAGASGPWKDAKALMVSPGGGGTYNGTVYDRYGNPLGGRSAFVGSSHGYGSTRVDLGSLAGKSVMFRWRVGSDNELDAYGWFVDDPKIVDCGKDTTASDTKLVKKPKKTTKLRTAVFTYRATEIGSTFQCKIDKKAWKKCGSKTTLKNLKKGKHTFQVRAVDRAKNKDKTPAKWTWTIK